MEFKRLNNMTGSDPVMNRRITSIFLQDVESFKELFSLLGEETQLEHIKFALHKIKPSLVIFEMDDMINQYEDLLNQAASQVYPSAFREKLDNAIRETEKKIEKVRSFLAAL